MLDTCTPMSALYSLLNGGDVNTEHIYYLPFECMCVASFDGLQNSTKLKLS